MVWIGWTEAFLTGAITTAEVNIETDNTDGFAALIGDNILLYDTDGWEVVTAKKNLEPNVSAGKDRVRVERGAHSSTAKSQLLGARALREALVISTHDLSSLTTLSHLKTMSFPTGHDVTFLYQDGRTQFDGVQIEANDEDETLTRLFKGRNVVGNRAVIFGGYEGMPFTDYVMLYTGKITKVGFRTGVYTFDVDANLDRINKTLFSQLGGFGDGGTTTATGTINSGDTTITLNDSSNMYDDSAGSNSMNISQGSGRYIGLYFRLEDTSDTTGDTFEYMLVNNTGHTDPLYSVTRGQLGTTALTITSQADQEIRLVYSFQDNPVNILLKLLLTTDVSNPSFSTGVQHTTYDLQFGGATDDALGCAFNVSDLDVESFETIRDDWIPNDIWRVDFYKSTRIKGWIEKHILKPLSMNWFLNKSGKLSLSYLKPPLAGEDSITLDESNVVGIPELEMTTDDVINDATVSWDYDVVQDDYGNITEELDATSQATYDVDRPINIEARGVDSNYGGATLASSYGQQKLRYFKDPNPLIPLPVLFNVGAFIEPGSIHIIDHPKIPNLTTGEMGLTRKVWISAKTIDWVSGTVELECIPILFGLDGRIAVVGPAGVSDFDSASEETKEKYIFISDVNGEMGDGTTGYVVY